jgi:hypothetical protein
MTSAISNQTTFINVSVEYLAQWSWIDIPPCRESAATPFGPATVIPAGERPSLMSRSGPKAVLYMPVKRASKQETFPKVAIFLSFFQASFLQKVHVPNTVGAEVVFEVRNLWPGAPAAPVTLKGKLDSKLEVRVEISPDDVKGWLAPGSSPFGARINENLLEFRFEIPSISVDGKPVRGQSVNRLFFYRRKTIVFLPGVFGSQVHVKLPNGEQVGFPDFTPKLLDTISALLPLPVQLLAGELNQRIGALECDADGVPLIEAIRPVLLQLKGGAYDVFDVAHAERMKLFPPVPEAFRLFTLSIAAYDWRGDLTQTTLALVAALKEAQSGKAVTALRNRPDTDDEVALAGHSTGGLLIRRALGEAGMEDVVSHAFFINVPFRGAPKALAVILTGCDPPYGGGFLSRMIPFVDPDSLRAISLTMPIVYHLAPSAALGTRPATTPDRPVAAPVDVEADKDSFITAAIESGLISNRMVVPSASGLSSVQRAVQAARAEDWHRFWNEYAERERGRALYQATEGTAPTATHRAWFGTEIAARALQDQLAARGTMVGWSQTLAKQAADFHRTSEAVAAGGKWASKAFVFFSIVEADPTMEQINLSTRGARPYSNETAFMQGEGLSQNQDWIPGDAHPGPPQAAGPGAVVYDGWSNPGGHAMTATSWRLDWSSRAAQGDATVPLNSLLGFGGQAQVLQAIPQNPKHSTTPNSGYVWRNIFRVLQGQSIQDVIETRANPATGALKRP